jgi:hypothetical protein
VRLFEDTEPNIAIFAIACVALLFAEEGKPIAIQDEMNSSPLSAPHLAAAEGHISAHCKTRRGESFHGTGRY